MVILPFGTLGGKGCKEAGGVIGFGKPSKAVAAKFALFARF